MTTAKRVWYEGAAYHITARGNHRNDIFRDDEDFQYYLTVIKEALLYYGINNYQLICYCLMDNHVHLMIKTDNKPLANLSKFGHASLTKGSDPCVNLPSTSVK